MVGSPASGKSTVVKSILKQYPNAIHISNDLTKSKTKSLKLFSQALLSQEPLIIIDNTHPSVASRAEFLSLLPTSHSYAVICIHCKLPSHLAVHLSRYRSYKNKITNMPAMAYHMYTSRFEEPTVDEGFDAIVPYIPQIPSYVKKLSLV